MSKDFPSYSLTGVVQPGVENLVIDALGRISEAETAELAYVIESQFSHNVSCC